MCLVNRKLNIFLSLSLLPLRLHAFVWVSFILSLSKRRDFISNDYRHLYEKWEGAGEMEREERLMISRQESVNRVMSGEMCVATWWERGNLESNLISLPDNHPDPGAAKSRIVEISTTVVLRYPSADLQSFTVSISLHLLISPAALVDGSVLWVCVIVAVSLSLSCLIASHCCRITV